MSDDMLGRLMRTNDELLKGVHWLMETNNVEAALKFLPVAEPRWQVSNQRSIDAAEKCHWLRNPPLSPALSRRTDGCPKP